MHIMKLLHTFRVFASKGLKLDRFLVYVLPIYKRSGTYSSLILHVWTRIILDQM